jgi:hypothetical protein
MKIKRPERAYFIRNFAVRLQLQAVGSTEFEEEAPAPQLYQDSFSPNLLLGPLTNWSNFSGFSPTVSPTVNPTVYPYERPKTRPDRRNLKLILD